MTSGQMVTTTTQHVECDGIVTHKFPLFASGVSFERSWPCTFAGEIDITIDPEGMTAGWECPNCTTWHDIPWDDRDDPDKEIERL